MYVDVFYAQGNSRSKFLAQAMARGIKGTTNDIVRMRPAASYDGIDADVAVFYGLAEGLNKVMADYSANSTAVYMDLGYWRRRINGKYDGYHKVTVNSRHPTAYFQNTNHSFNRFRQLNLRIEPWRKGGDSILVAGMSGKAAAAEGLVAEAWERDIIQQISVKTSRKIIYRPKPNFAAARAIRNSIFQRGIEIPQAFNNCHAVVSHHSNVSVDAILAGVPSFCWNGVASTMSLDDINRIDMPWMPDNREQWAANIAYCQWSVEEMCQGLPWKHLKSEGLVK